MEPSSTDKRDDETVKLSFQGGTLRVTGLAAAELPDFVRWDEREAVHRLPAVAYADLIRWLRAQQITYVDEARAYGEHTFETRVRKEPFPHQKEAIYAWTKARSRGVVVLPTGSGKTLVATMAIEARGRSAIVVVPTLDLLNQWYDALVATFARAVGVVGGGYHEVHDLTVTTYDSAHLHMDRLGNRFGLIIFDEAHHLPSDTYAMAAKMCLAPFRLGLTATPERVDGREELYRSLVGPICYRREITELSGDYLASYETVRLEIALSPDERAAYDEARAEYLSFLRANSIRMSAPDGWQRFVLLSSQSDTGRRAFAAYRRQRALAMAAPGKLEVLERLLHTHRSERTIVFTEDNATAYQISRRFLIPVITHQTKIKERSFILAAYRSGELGSIVTSKVLNEGVDVPEASVGIVLSGSGSVREHVQRLGRILRKTEGKRALLYELVALNTNEERTSDKRREHVAYR
jgi:superfamily II DNA or RNA helicase